MRSLALFVLFAAAVASAANVAFNKPYTLSEPGMAGLVFSRHTGNDYDHIPVYRSEMTYPLVWTETEPLSSLPHGLLWHHADGPFNVSVTLDIGSMTNVAQLRLFGACCNMGIYTPTAAYLEGSVLADGPFELIASKTNLTSGDQLETPAVTYVLDLFATIDIFPYQYYRVTVTGEPNRFISIISIQLFD